MGGDIGEMPENICSEESDFLSVGESEKRIRESRAGWCWSRRIQLPSRLLSSLEAGM